MSTKPSSGIVAKFDYNITDSLSNQVGGYAHLLSWKKASLPVSLGCLGLAELFYMLLPLLFPLLFLPRTLWVPCSVFLPLLPLFHFILSPICRPWPSLLLTMNGGLKWTLAAQCLNGLSLGPMMVPVLIISLMLHPQILSLRLLALSSSISHSGIGYKSIMPSPLLAPAIVCEDGDNTSP